MNSLRHLAVAAALGVLVGCNTFADVEPIALDASDGPDSDSGSDLPTMPDFPTPDVFGSYVLVEESIASFEVGTAREFTMATLPSGDFRAGPTIIATLSDQTVVPLFGNSLAKPREFRPVGEIALQGSGVDVYTSIDMLRNPNAADEILVAGTGSQSDCLQRPAADQVWGWSLTLGTETLLPTTTGMAIATQACAQTAEGTGSLLPSATIVPDVLGGMRYVVVEGPSNGEAVSLDHDDLGIGSMVRTANVESSFVAATNGGVLFATGDGFRYWAATQGVDDVGTPAFSGSASLADAAPPDSPGSLDQSLFEIAGPANGSEGVVFLGRSLPDADLVVADIACIANAFDGTVVSETTCDSDTDYVVYEAFPGVSFLEARGISDTILAAMYRQTDEAVVELILVPSPRESIEVFSVEPLTGLQAKSLAVDAYSLGLTDFVVTVAVLVASEDAGQRSRVVVWTGRFSLG